MPIGIKPTVDFAFKKIFGSPENSEALIGLLNAILDRPIDTVEILNPFTMREFAETKQVVLDLRCREPLGRWLNVEMQVSIHEGLLERLVYYAAKTEDKQMYDQREKAQRDYEWALSSARSEGHKEGLEQGREEGREEGLEKGNVVGKIQVLQELLSETPTTASELYTLSLDTLATQLAELQHRLRDRPA